MQSNKNKPLVSVIIPCYNQGIYLDEAIDSVLSQTYQNLEIIVINDGSTDEFTNNLLSDYKRDKTTVLITENQGLSNTRNTGIKKAKGKYILPLDADDKIGKEYIEEAVNVLEKDKKIGIVYCEAELFGANSGKWHLQPYSFPEILLGNRIFCSGIFRKSDWEKTGGYDPKFTYGGEDYDLWLSFIEAGLGVYQIPKSLFFYRIKKGSMTMQLDDSKREWIALEVFKKHKSLYMDNMGFILHSIFKLQHQVIERNEKISNLEKQVNDFASKIHIPVLGKIKSKIKKII